jgi:hypothetical protein
VNTSPVATTFQLTVSHFRNCENVKEETRIILGSAAIEMQPFP